MKNPLPMTRSGYPTPLSNLTPRLTQMVAMPFSMVAKDARASGMGPGSNPRTRMRPARSRATALLPEATAAASASARSEAEGSPASMARMRRISPASEVAPRLVLARDLDEEALLGPRAGEVGPPRRGRGPGQAQGVGPRGALDGTRERPAEGREGRCLETIEAAFRNVGGLLAAQEIEGLQRLDGRAFLDQPLDRGHPHLAQVRRRDGVGSARAGGEDRERGECGRYAERPRGRTHGSASR